MRINLVVAILLLVWILPVGFVSAANEQQQECFGYLQSSILAVPAFSSIHEEVGVVNYADVEGQLSDYYKNISSFGVDLRSPDFDMRIYTFGRDTGYQHPPFSPFPTYTLSDKWETPAKEYIYAEEYVRNTETNERIFISCALMAIETRNLEGVTAERYLYDGALSSVLFTDPDQNYKVWYSNNDSYDHEGRNFVSWRRLFVYPKSTVNGFFDKYTVAESFPTRITDSLSNIKKSIARDHTSETRALLAAPEMKGLDKVFSLNTYYQAIENSFPEFGAKLALRGVLEYNTVKELLSTRGVPEFEVFWQSVLDPRELTKYALLKKNNALTEDNRNGIPEAGEVNAFFESQLARISNMTLEQEAKRLLETVPERNPVPLDEPEVTVVNEEESTPMTYQELILIGVIIGVLVISSLLIMFRNRKRAVDIPTDSNVTLQ